MRSRITDMRSPEAIQQQERNIPTSKTSTRRTSTPDVNGRVEPHKGSLSPAEGWSPLLLLAVALYCIVTAIISVKWVSHSSLFYWSPLVGLLLGLGVSKVRGLPPATLHVAACLIGYWLALWMTCSVAFHIPWSDLFVSFYVVLVGGIAPQGLPVNDIAFFFYLYFLCFFLGYFGCWLVYRARMPWLVALVYCSIMLVNLNYVQHDPSFLVIVMAVALLLLVARVQLASQLLSWIDQGLYAHRRWRQRLVWRCMQAACLLSLLICLFGWILPAQPEPASGASMWNSINNLVNNITSGRISLANASSLFQGQASTNFFSDQLTISGSVQLPSGEVLNYTSSAGPRYLEGYTLNHFDGHTWINTPSATAGRQDYTAGTLLPLDIDIEQAAGFPRVETRVTIVHPPQETLHYIFAPAQPQLFDVATTVYGRATAESWVQQSPLVQGEIYNVTSVEPPANTQGIHTIPLPQDDMRVWQQDGNYIALSPDLQLPGDLSPQVRQTMIQWTAGAGDAYSALQSLESHLSDTTVFTYSVNNPPIPSNIDVVDWLLQTRRGYCTYYATAMTIMARMLGIPARIVNGFSQGTLDRQHNRWSVSGSDAHSWVQAYLPGYGWVNFDPTPGFAAGADPNQGSFSLPGAPLQPQPTPTPTAQPTPTPTSTRAYAADPHMGLSATGDSASAAWWLVGSGLVVALLAAGVFMLLTLRRWWRNLYRGQSFASEKFWRICRLAGWLGLGPRSWQTPYEYGEMLSRYVPQQAFPLWCLTNLFVQERWGASVQPMRPVSEAKRVVERSWRALLAALVRGGFAGIKRRVTSMLTRS
jgi:transglutaminase-like putative cysteine protease